MVTFLANPQHIPNRTSSQPESEPVEAPVKLSSTEQKILGALADKTLSTKELLHALGYSQKTGNYKQAMERLTAHQLVEYTLPEKPNSRLQKYCLTTKGRTLI